MSEVLLDANCTGPNTASMAELSLIAYLKSTASEVEEKAADILLPCDLVEVLLHDKTPVKTNTVKEVLSALDKNITKSTQFLDVVSLRCMAYILLNSGVEAGLERGLYILLDGSQSNAKSDLTEGQSTALPGPGLSHLTGRRLINVLYRIFVDGAWSPEIRRLAGKLLIELMLESGNRGALSLEVQEQGLAGVISKVTLEVDAVLKFFASVIIRILHIAGINTDFPRTPDDTTHRRAFFYSPDIPNDDIVKSYYLYIREAEREASSDQRVQPEHGNGAKGPSHDCYVLKSIAIDTNTLAKGTILTISTASSLLFIYTIRSAYGKYISYIEVPLQSISSLMWASASQCGGQESSLCLHLSPNCPITMNGRSQVVQGQAIILQSEEDLTTLREAVNGIGVGVKMNDTAIQSKIRRSSSIVVPLDTAEIVVRKSKRLSEARARREKNTSSHSVNHGGMSRASDKVCPVTITRPITASPNGSQRGNEERKSIGKGASTDKESTKCLQMDSLYLGKQQSYRLHDNSMTENSASSQDTVAYPTSQERKPTEPRRNRSNKPASTTRKTRQLRSKHKRSALSNNGTPNLRLSNTQESLIFHHQRSHKKVYTAHSKAAVDWDEDIRPSGESELSKQHELTSVSSPAPGDSSTFDKRPILEQRRKCQASSSAKKCRKPPAKRNSGALEERGSRSEELLTGEPKISEAIGTLKEIRSGLSDTGKCTTDDDNMTETSVKRNSSPPKPTLDSKHENEDGENSHTTNDSAYEHLQTPTKFLSLEAKVAGRGESVGKKLAAAFQRGETSPQRKHDQNQRHDTSPNSRKSQISPETAPSAQPGKDVSNTNQLVEPGLAWDGYDGDDYTISHSSMNLVVGRTRPREAREGGQDNCQKTGQEPEMLSVGIEKVAIELSGGGLWEHEARTKGSTSPSSSRQSPCQAQILRGITPTIRSVEDSDSPDKTTEASKSLSSKGGDEPGPGSVGSVIMEAAMLEEDSSLPEGSLHSDNSQSQRRLAEHSWMTPRKSIVDKNGSPRLLSQVEIKLMTSGVTVHCESQSSQLVLETKTPVQDIDDESGYDGGLEESFSEEQIFDDADSMPAPTTCGEGSGVRIENPLRSRGSDALIDAQGSEFLGPFGSPAAVASIQRKGVCAQGARLPRGRGDRIRSMRRGAYSPTPIFQKERKRIDSRSQGSCQSPSQAQLVSSNSPWDIAVPSRTHVHEDVGLNDGDTSLLALQRDTQGILLASNEHLRYDLEGERKAVNKVLETYRQQCHRVLDQLFEAQEERINLCNQQQELVRHQHATVCQELIRRLEANERCTRKRTNSHLGSSPEERKKKKKKRKNT